MEQIDRTRRYLERIRAAYAGVPFREDGREYYSDDVYSFFINCHHIRDWIVQLNLAWVTQSDVDAFVDRNEQLRICADLCNGTKHCKLTRKPRTGRQPHLATASLLSSGVGDTLLTTTCEFTVLSGGIFHDALELAEDCMSLWDGFVAELGAAPE